MNQILLSILLFISGEMIQLQPGVYSYENSNVSEVLKLNPNKTFDYEFDGHMLHYSISGVWSVSEDILFLNSLPQRDRIIVREKKKSFTNKYCITVTDKKGNAINYSINLNWDDGGETILRGQWDKTKIRNSSKLKSFSIQDTKGIKSPTYEIKGSKTNHFDVIVETTRVFEMESWQIDGSEIIPNLIDGSKGTYSLKKQK